MRIIKWFCIIILILIIYLPIAIISTYGFTTLGNIAFYILLLYSFIIADKYLTKFRDWFESKLK